MKGIHQRIVASLVIVVIIVTLGLLAWRYASMEWLLERETSLRDYVRTSPWHAWLIGFCIYTGLSLVPGISGKAVIFGWLFGFWSGLLLVVLSLTSAAMATFLFSRYLFREAIESRFGVHLIVLRNKLDGDAAFYLLMLRLLHTPFSFVNYGAGATNVVSARTFWWTTQVGLLPGTTIFVLAGTRVPSLEVLAADGFMSLLDPVLIAALAATPLLPLLLRMAVRTLYQTAPRPARR